MPHCPTEWGSFIRQELPLHLPRSGRGLLLSCIEGVLAPEATGQPSCTSCSSLDDLLRPRGEQETQGIPDPSCRKFEINYINILLAIK
jgi:hypothetical protein